MKKKLLVGVLLAVVIASQALYGTGISMANGGSGGWVINPANGHGYRLTERKTWLEAEAQAVAWGGHLVTINEEAEELWLEDTFATGEILWIGFNDITVEGIWQWVSDEPVTYTNWCPGEPNNCGSPGCSPEDVAVINCPCGEGGDYAWNDIPGGSLFGIVEAAPEVPQFVGTNLFLSNQAPASKDRGSALIFIIHYHNFGNTTAQNVVLRDNLPTQVEFVSASDGGIYDSGNGTVTWDIGSVAPLAHAPITLEVTIPSDVPIGTIIENNASISTSTVEARYDDNEAHAHTRVTGTNLPPNVGVEPNLGGTTPSIYWRNPTTFSYYDPTATSVNIVIQVNDGGPDITGTMTEGPPDWTYTTTFYPRHGRADVKYTVEDPSPYYIDFDVRNMRGFENAITEEEIEEIADKVKDYIQTKQPQSPMLDEDDIGERFVRAGQDNNVNPAFLVATAEHESQFGTQGWALTNPEAHNAFGYGVPSGTTAPDEINSAGSWGDMVKRVAWSIAHGEHYYTQHRYTVDQIRKEYAKDPKSQSIANYMNALIQDAGVTGFDEDFSMYIDPAGYVYNVDTGARIASASVWLQRPDGLGGWDNVPTGQTLPIMQPDVNPLVTGANGQYQWDVLEGSYRVHVEAPGYFAADSIVVSIPPPVTDLHVGLTPLPYDLTITSTAGGNVTTPGEGIFTYSYGTGINLVAEPEEGFHFVNWAGDVNTIGNSEDATTTITMNGDYSIIANFVETQEPCGSLISISTRGTPVDHVVQTLLGLLALVSLPAALWARRRWGNRKDYC
jgi:uncharacterized repeat protein (TIGR01451 family)